eukprot:TRINITY_DN11612_c0_g2_i5.p1 TRINITY_DN11612_c0_g2~~TRINITY_DN11612_c0_g2_i5.p1  ORF type:complete len:1098 (+),score=226.78 TRINITY_DN11612_c0_g2_i5:75-3368(+)
MHSSGSTMMTGDQALSNARKSYSQAAANLSVSSASPSKSAGQPACSSTSTAVSTPSTTRRTSGAASPKHSAMLDAEAIQQRLRQEGVDARNLIAYSVPLKEQTRQDSEEGFTVVQSKRQRNQLKRQNKASQRTRSAIKSKAARVGSKSKSDIQRSTMTRNNCASGNNTNPPNQSRNAEPSAITSSASRALATDQPSIVTPLASSPQPQPSRLHHHSTSDNSEATVQARDGMQDEDEGDDESLKSAALERTLTFDRSMPSTPGRKPVDQRIRHWTYLLEQLHRAVDDIYSCCEEDTSDDQCREVVLILDGARKDFQALIDRFHVQAEAAASTTPMAVAWDVRKSARPSPAGSLMSSLNSNFGLLRPHSARSITSSTYEERDSVQETPDILDLAGEESEGSAVASLNASFANTSFGNTSFGDPLPEGASWASDQDTWLAEMQMRSPGGGAKMHERLSSPGRKRPSHEAAQRAAARQERAKANRQLLQRAQDERRQKHKERLTGARQRRQRSGELIKQSMEHKQLKAEELRQSHLREVRERGRLEEQKKQEILFIQKLEQENLKMEALEKQSLEQARLEQLSARRKRRAEEKAAKEQAVLNRKRALEAERIQKLQEKEARRQARIAERQAELQSQSSRRPSPRKASRPTSADTATIEQLLTTSFQYPQVEPDLAKRNKQKLKRLRARAKKVRPTPTAMKSAQLEQRCQGIATSIQAHNSKELSRHVSALTSAMRKSGYELASLATLASVLQAWMSQPKLVAMDTLAITCSTILEIVERVSVTYAQVKSADNAQLAELLTMLCHGDLHVWLDAMVNMSRTATSAPIYLTFAKPLAEATAAILQICTAAHRVTPLVDSIKTRLVDVAQHLQLVNVIELIMAVCAFAATQSDDGSLYKTAEAFVQLCSAALHSDKVLGNTLFGVSLLEQPHGLATMVHWAHSDWVATKTKATVVDIAASVSLVSHSMAPAWLCHHDAWTMARVALAAVSDKHGGSVLNALRTLVQTSPSHRQAFGRAGLIERLAKLDIDSMHPRSKGVLAMLNVWLGYDELNLERMIQALGDVMWILPAIDRFGDSIGSIAERADLKQFYQAALKMERSSRST